MAWSETEVKTSSGPENNWNKAEINSEEPGEKIAWWKPEKGKILETFVENKIS